jgi:hypothetical protein
MREPRRLFDESESELERALLQAGSSYRSSRRARAKTLAALGLAGSATFAAGAAGASILSPLAKLTWTKLLVAVSAVGAVTAIPVGYSVWHQREARARSGPSRSMVVASVAGGADNGRPAPPMPMPFSEPAPSLAPAGNTTAGPAARPARSSARSIGRTIDRIGDRTGNRTTTRLPAERTGATVTLTQELAALDAARSALARGNAQGALFLLDAYDQTCPQGRLELEGEVLRIDALAKNGQTNSARRHAEAFLRRHPTSVLASRARGYLTD